MTRVLLVDDHPMIAAALEMLLRGTDYELLGRARTAAEALLDSVGERDEVFGRLGDGSGLDVLKRVSRPRSRLKTILLTAGMDEAQLLAAAELSPQGMVLKTSDPGLLLECMDAVVAGNCWIDAEIAEQTRHAQEKAASG